LIGASKKNSTFPEIAITGADYDISKAGFLYAENRQKGLDPKTISIEESDTMRIYPLMPSIG